jgi:DNA-binding SARP family transcriptional activator
LAYLAAEAGRPQNRTTLAGLLWPDWPEEAASKNLRHTLYSLRKALGDPTCLEADRQWITLAAGVRQRNRIRAGAVLYTDPGEPARLYARGVAIFARSQGVNL